MRYLSGRAARSHHCPGAAIPTSLTPAQQAVLREVPEKVPPSRIDRLWIFAPHQVKSRETGLLLFSLLMEPALEPEPRAVAAGGGHASGPAAERAPAEPVVVNPAEMAPGGPRTLLTLRYRAETVKGTLCIEETLAEEGRAPPDRIEKVVAGVLVRSGFEAAEPLLETIAGSEARWAALLARHTASA